MDEETVHKTRGPQLLNVGQSAATAAAVVALVGAAVGSYGAARRAYRKTSVGSRRALSTKLRPLRPGITTELLYDRLGVPETRHSLSPCAYWPEGSTAVRYSTRHAIILAVLVEDAVQAVSVRVTDERFHFSFSGRESVNSRVAGRDRFSAVDLASVRTRELVEGNHPHMQWYLEAAGIGTGADPNFWIYGWLPTGVGPHLFTIPNPTGPVLSDDGTRATGIVSASHDNDLSFRSSLLINTVTMLPEDGQLATDPANHAQLRQLLA